MIVLLFEIAAFGVAVAGIVLLLSQVPRLLVRLQAMEQRLDSVERGSATPAFASAGATRPLVGLRLALAITQDHEHPVFAAMLKEQLLKEDVLEVSFLAPEAAARLQADWPAGEVDILVIGKLTCNGYAEIYYDADFTCHTSREPICTLIERPPHGDRPTNLAIELVARLNVELENLLTRTERRDALRELRG